MNCTRCEGTGFLNLGITHQFPEDILEQGWEEAYEWFVSEEAYGLDIQVCDCCGDGESWYGEPGRHYGVTDEQGPYGPYAYNGGVCECH